MKNLSWLLLLVFAVSFSAFAQSPGDTIGWTQNPYQTDGSTGHRIAVDIRGGIHFTWVGGTANNHQIYYNFLGTDGYLWPGVGDAISQNGCGFPQIDVTEDGRAIVVYHKATPTGSESLFCAIDMAPGLGTFEYHRPPNRLTGSNNLIWPYITVDRNNRIQIVATSITTGAQIFGYSRSNNGGTTWTALQAVDTLKTISPIIISSPVSDKVAIVYCHPTDTSGIRNDVFYIQSEDGTAWDFSAGKVNITSYGIGGDSVFAYTDVDAVYDYNDNLHIAWNAQWAMAHNYSYRTFLFHYSSGSGTIQEIIHIDLTRGCAYLGLPLNKPSMVADSAHNLLNIAYSRYDTSDCSGELFANGEIYIQQSNDNGESWFSPIDVTNSHTPGCTSNCASDQFPSIAKRIDDYIHIFYMCNRDPNYYFPPYDPSPMLYLRLPAGPVNTGEGGTFPSSFGLTQNYPNPFNAQTTIKYTLKETGTITLSIYNIMGQKVTILVNGMQEAGEHQVIWNGKDAPSGVYFARLEVGSTSQKMKMVLLK